ncbi:SMP-30/gluconolactonase/LRE family protein [Sphingobium sp.]|uniref:SMP-30/gluconolactonase/LRE family protein n=1 Tax=Sphingobium sp. TaxID=1912891 RepID=UPI0028BD5C11|nr:SMP-30/gluconolactonase/LRE family protein [Sphingobium sp.]
MSSTCANGLMRRGFLERSAALVGFALVRPAVAAEANGLVASIERADSALDRLLDRQPRLERLYSGAGFLEAPLWVPDERGGYLAFSDIAHNLIGRIDDTGTMRPVLAPVFRGDDVTRIPIFKKGDDYLPMAGPNGMALDPNGRIVFCGFAGSRRILRLEPDGNMAVLADRFEGRRFNTTNDLAFASDGSLYFTDTDMRPAMVREADIARPDAPDAGIPHSGIYRLKNGRIELMDRTAEFPNGVALSPDGLVAYVTETFRRRILKYRISTDGRFGAPNIFHDMSSSTLPGFADGLKVDSEGNVYSTGPGGVWIFNADGVHLGTIRVPEFVTNIAFGGPVGKSLYLSGLSNLYRMPLLHA